MKCLVAIKRVIDPYVNIRVKSDNSGVETTNVKMAINPFDEIAVEEAVLLKEKNIVSEIIVVTIDTKAAQETIRQSLARGADRGILITTEQFLPPIDIAKVLKELINRESPDIVLMGKQAIDDDCNQTGQMLAGFLGWSQGTFASNINIQNDTKLVDVTREVDGGLETLQLKLPAVITADLRLNEPRYISLPNVMKAKRKPISVIPLEEFGISFSERLKVLKVTPPPVRSSGIKVNDAEELVDKLKNEAKVI